MATHDDGTLHTIDRPDRIDRVTVVLTVNGTRHEVAVRPYDVLLDVLRDDLGMTGTRRGCDMGTCGCCTVLLDGRPVLSCLTLAIEAGGSEVTTIEGVASMEGDGALHPLQEAFVRTGGSQCGFCTPGFIMTALALIASNPDPDEDRIREAISGNMCRCTGYVAIIEAIRMAAADLRARRQGAGARAPRAPEGAP